MVSVLITIDKKGFFANISVVGHSNYPKNEKNEDIVCASISSIVYGTFNAITSLIDEKHYTLDITEEISYIKVINPINELQLLLDCFIIQLKTIESSYPKHIKIEKEKIC